MEPLDSSDMTGVEVDERIIQRLSREIADLRERLTELEQEKQRLQERVSFMQGQLGNVLLRLTVGKTLEAVERELEGEVGEDEQSRGSEVGEGEGNESR